MPAAQKTPLRRARAHDRGRGEDNERVLSHIMASLDLAQAHLNQLRGTLRAGANDPRNDLPKLLRDARRDIEKMTTVSRKDLRRLQKDAVGAAQPAAAESRGARVATKPTTRSSGAAR